MMRPLVSTTRRLRSDSDEDEEMVAIRGVEHGTLALRADDIPGTLRAEIERALTLANPDFDEAIRAGRTTRGLAPLLHYAWKDGAMLVLPRGTRPWIEQLVARGGIELRIEDRTTVCPASFPRTPALSDIQETAVGRLVGPRHVGLLVAPPGSGKSRMACAAIAQRGQSALWLTHSAVLADQAAGAAVECLGLEIGEIGRIGAGVSAIGNCLTIALVQSLARHLPRLDVDAHRFGTVVVDEAHHAAASGFTSVLEHLPARYLLGLTATPIRRQEQMTDVINFYLGPELARIAAEDLPDRLVPVDVFWRDVDCSEHAEIFDFSQLLSRLVGDPRRNTLIVADVLAAVKAGRRPLVLSARIEHAERLAVILRAHGVAAAVVHGKVPKRERQRVLAGVQSGAVEVLCATTSLLGEGTDLPVVDVLVIATPMRFEGALTQFVGRVRRSAPGKARACVLDYVDRRNPVTESQWRARKQAYLAEGHRVSAYVPGTRAAA